MVLRFLTLALFLGLLSLQPLLASAGEAAGFSCADGHHAGTTATAPSIRLERARCGEHGSGDGESGCCDQACADCCGGVLPLPVASAPLTHPGSVDYPSSYRRDRYAPPSTDPLLRPPSC